MSSLQAHFSDEAREYTGRELRSHFALDAFGLVGDSIVAFVGPARVELTEMVDLEDVRRREPIYGPLMVHAIVEHFGVGLREMVLRQRLLVRLAGDILLEAGPARLEIRGDDLYLEGRKASVSIATRSPVSALIHLGVNVETEGTPLPTWGLVELGIDPAGFGRELLRRYCVEIHDVQVAVAKVRGVP